MDIKKQTQLSPKPWVVQHLEVREMRRNQQGDFLGPSVGVAENQESLSSQKPSEEKRTLPAVSHAANK